MAPVGRFNWQWENYVCISRLISDPRGRGALGPSKPSSQIHLNVDDNEWENTFRRPELVGDFQQRLHCKLDIAFGFADSLLHDFVEFNKVEVVPRPFGEGLVEDPHHIPGAVSHADDDDRQRILARLDDGPPCGPLVGHLAVGNNHQNMILEEAGYGQVTLGSHL